MFVAIVIVGVLIAATCAALLARPPRPKGRDDQAPASGDPPANP